MLKVITFDMDGTIIDTDEVIIKSWIELIKLYKNKDYIIDHEHIRTYSGPPIEYAINDCFPELEYDFILKEYRKRTKKYYETDLKLFNNTYDVIKKLYEDGYQLAIVTSKNKEMCIKCLKRFKLISFFKYIITCDDIVEQKPNPEGMNKVLKHFNVKSDEVLSIGDTQYDYYAAKNANINSIILTMCKRSFDKDVHPYCFCDNYLDLYKEIRKYD